jgi:hypothetical protein
MNGCFLAEFHLRSKHLEQSRDTVNTYKRKLDIHKFINIQSGTPRRIRLTYTEHSAEQGTLDNL